MTSLLCPFYVCAQQFFMTRLSLTSLINCASSVHNYTNVQLTQLMHNTPLASSWEICLRMRQISLRERVEIA